MERGNSMLRNADRYVGIPLLLVLSFLSPLLRVLRRWGLSKEVANSRSVGILVSGAIGDLVLASSIVRDIKAEWPDAAITLFVSKANAGAAKLMPHVSATVVLPITKPWATLRMMRQHSVSWLIDLGPWPRINALITAFCSARHTVGFRSEGQYRHFLYDHVIDYRSELHFVDNVRMTLLPMRIPRGQAPMVRRDLDSTTRIDGKYVVLHPWPGGYRFEYKMWAADRWVEVGEWLKARGIKAVITGGPDDALRAAALTSLMDEAGVDCINMAGRCSLQDTSVLLRESEAVVSVNTGIFHIAAAVGARCIGLHGPTNVGRWGGIGERVINLSARGADSGYLNHGYEYPAQPADVMGRITVSEVVYALALQLEAAEGALVRYVDVPRPIKAGATLASDGTSWAVLPATQAS